MTVTIPSKDDNDIVYESLKKGNTINKFQAQKDLGVGSLPQRIYDLKHQGNIIYDRFVCVINRQGQRIRVKEYSLTPFI